MKKERARGTSPLLIGSHSCVRAHYVRFTIAVATPREGVRKWEFLESDSFIASFFFFFNVVVSFLLERQLFLALVFLSLFI